MQKFCSSLNQKEQQHEADLKAVLVPPIEIWLVNKISWVLLPVPKLICVLQYLAPVFYILVSLNSDSRSKH